MKEKLIFIGAPKDDLINDLKKLLEKNQWQVELYDSGVTLLWKLAQHPSPDLIMLDLALPSPHAYEILQYLKTSSDYREIPVIIFSDLNHKSEIERSLILGAKAHLTKGASSPTLLLASVENFIQEKERDAEKPLPTMMYTSPQYLGILRNFNNFNELIK